MKVSISPLDIISRTQDWYRTGGLREGEGEKVRQFERWERVDKDGGVERVKSAHGLGGLPGTS